MMIAGHMPDLYERDPKPTNKPMAAKWPDPPPREVKPKAAEREEISADVLAVVWRVAEAHGVKARAILARRGISSICIARHEVFARAHAELGLSLSAIGRMFGVHHTSVAHAIDAHHERTAKR